MVANVAGRLPQVGRVRLTDVDDEKLRLILVLFIETVERGNLPAKWRSSVTPEDEDYGSSTQGRKLYLLRAIQSLKSEVRRRFSHL